MIENIKRRNKMVYTLEQIQEMPELELISIDRAGVNPRTQEEYDTLMQVFELGGWRWDKYSGPLPTEFNAWRICKADTCVAAGNMWWAGGRIDRGKFGFHNRQAYETSGTKIIEPEQFYNAQPKITAEKLREINQWFDKYKPNRKSKG